MTTNQNIFDSLIGIKGVGTPADTVNTLNGIDDESVAFLTFANQSTTAVMFDKVKSQAYELLELEFIRQIPKNKSFSSLISSTTKVGISLSSETYTALVNNYAGCVVQVNKIPDKTKITIKGLDFVSDTAFATNLKVFNLLTGIELYSSAINVQAGINELSVNQSFNFTFGSGLYFIGFLPSIGAEFKELLGDGSTNVITVTPSVLPVALPVNHNNTSEIKSVFNVIASVDYSYSKIIEDNKELFATPFKYACGAVMLEWILSSKKASRETLINREGMEALATCYRADAVRFIENVSSEVIGKIVATGNVKESAKKLNINSLGSFA
jgi:hypothetical protein